MSLISIVSTQVSLAPGKSVMDINQALRQAFRTALMDNTAEMMECPFYEISFESITRADEIYFGTRDVFEVSDAVYGVLTQPHRWQLVRDKIEPFIEGAVQIRLLNEEGGLLRTWYIGPDAEVDALRKQCALATPSPLHPSPLAHPGPEGHSDVERPRMRA